jgi:tetratricopeptide (TPR) repeat protein
MPVLLHENATRMDALFYILIAVAAVGLLVVSAVLLFKRDNRKIEERHPWRALSRRERNNLLREANRRLSQNPRDAPALRDLGEIAFEDEDYAAAVKYFGALLPLCPANPEIDELGANLRLAQSLLKLGKLEEARRHFLLARTIDEEGFEANFNLGLMEYSQKNHAKALGYLGAAREQRPDDVATNRYLGHSFYRLQQFDQAAAALQRVLDFEPEDKKTQFVLARSYHSLRQSDLALQIFSRLRTDPEVGAMAALYAGTLNLNAKRPDLALADFDIGLRHANTEPGVLLELRYRAAEAHLRQGEVRQAIRLWKEIAAEAPDFRDVRDKISQYREINSSRNLQIFLMSPTSEFIGLCRKIVLGYFANASSKLLNISLPRAEYADILAQVHTPQWEDLALFRFVRSSGATGELLLRELHARSKEVRASRAVCATAGTFSEQARAFVEARMIDLVDKDGLLKLLRRL